MERGEEELLEVLDTDTRRPGGQCARDVELREAVPQGAAIGI